MNAAMYPDADQSDTSSPTMNRTPAVPWCPPTLWIALVKIVFAGPGATVARLLISG
jgi:hypothetical protein